MPTFLESALCEGRRPRHLAALRYRPRPDLISRLLRDRQVARFIVAPDGFGKTSLAFGYAETVFSFDHVAWINAKSPCFLRDLDAGVIAAGSLAADGRAALAVLDDVPPLSPERAALLSQQIDALLAAGCEVLVCCPPSCDAFASLQRDRIRLSSADLLLSDDELQGEGSSSEGERAEQTPPSLRVAALRWGPPDASRGFLAGVAREELPSDLLLAMTAMLILREGALDEMEAFGPCGDAVLRPLATGYPFLGIDERRGTFRAPSFDPGDVVGAWGAKWEAAAARSRFPEADALACALADALTARREGSRACSLVGAACGRAERASWLARQGSALLQQACLLPASDLWRHLGAEGRRADLEADEAWRAFLLGDETSARRCARKAAASAAEGEQILGLLVLSCQGGAREREDARSRLAGWAALPPSPAGEGAAGALRQLAALWDLSSLPADEALSRWRRRCPAAPHAVLAAASWRLFEDARIAVQDAASVRGAIAVPGENVPDGRLLADVALAMGRVMEDDPASGGVFAALAHAEWEELRSHDDSLAPLAGPRAARDARALEASVLSQRNEVERRRRERDLRRARYAATHPDSFLDGRFGMGGVAADRGAPLLTVNLFGGMEVRIGAERVDPGKLRRRKVKTLLALLVLNRGRDFSRDRLMETMWPGAEPIAARKNFYTIWSQLRAALTLPTGECPYLIRQEAVCRLDGSLLQSDVAEFDEICRTLLFGKMGPDGWARLSAEVENRFADDLMPGEHGNDVIESLRGECRTRLVDSLVAASRRLVAEGRIQEGLWFARASLKRDRTREDAYTALMEAQVAAGQRAAALETYFKCRRFLADELGIDPSLRTVGIYRGIIESEEGLE